MKLPQTQAQADRIAKQFAADAARWNSYVEGDDDSDSQDLSAPVNLNLGGHRDHKLSQLE